MKKIIALYGIIAGAIPGISFFLYMPTDAADMMNMEYGTLIGFTVMIVAFSTIFIGINHFRKTQGNRYVGFGKAFLIGLGISLIASVIYAGSWEAFTSLNEFNFAEQYQVYQEKVIAQSGEAPEVIAQNQKDNAEQMELYQNNVVYRFVITMTETFPVGLLISLLAALVYGVILKPKN